MTVDISIIVPVKNGESYLDHLLPLLDATASAAGSVEVVVVDDMSTDRTSEILERHAEQDKRYTILRGRGQGVAAARNQALQVVRGQYVWLTDADDAWEPSIVRDMWTQMRGTQADLGVCNALKVGPGPDQSSVICDAPAEEILETAELLDRVLTGEIQGHLWNKLFRREVLVAAPFPSTRAHSDLGGFLTVIPRVKTAVLIPRTLYRYEIHPGSIINSRAYRWEDLFDCRDIACTSASRITGDFKDNLTAFSLTHVGLPVAQETARRRGSMTQQDLDAVDRRVTTVVDTRAILLVVRRKRAAVALQLALFQVSPPAFRWFYSRHRRARWRAIDRF